MNAKKLKKLRKRLRDEKSESEPVAAVLSEQQRKETLARQQSSVASPERLLMRRKDPTPNGLARAYQGGAQLHPLCKRAMYQFAKKKGIGE